MRAVQNRKLLRTGHLLVSDPGIVPFKTEKAFAAPAEYWTDEFTAVAVGDIAVIYQPSSTCSKSSSILWLPRGTDVRKGILQHIKTWCGDVKMWSGPTSRVLVGTKVSSLQY